MKVYERILMESCGDIPYNVMDDNSLETLMLENAILGYSNSMNELFFNALNEITTESYSGENTMEGFLGDIWSGMIKQAKIFWEKCVKIYNTIKDMFNRKKKQKEKDPNKPQKSEDEIKSDIEKCSSEVTEIIEESIKEQKNNKDENGESNGQRHEEAAKIMKEDLAKMRDASEPEEKVKRMKFILKKAKMSGTLRKKIDAVSEELDDLLDDLSGSSGGSGGTVTEESAIEYIKSHSGMKLIQPMYEYGTCIGRLNGRLNGKVAMGYFTPALMMRAIDSINEKGDYENILHNDEYSEALAYLRSNILGMEKELNESQFQQELHDCIWGKSKVETVTSALVNNINIFKNSNISKDVIDTSMAKTEAYHNELIKNIKLIQSKLGKKDTVSKHVLHDRIKKENDINVTNADNKPKVMQYLKLCINMHTQFMKYELQFLKTLGKAHQSMENDIKTIIIPSVIADMKNK